MSTKKTITINTRVNEAVHTEMLEKAQTYFGGNLSALIRCATVRYTEDVQTSGVTGTTTEVAASFDAIIKLLRKIGNNHNQLVKNVNEKMKLSPLAFNPSDLQPLKEFGEGLTTIQDMLRYLYNMLKQ